MCVGAGDGNRTHVASLEGWNSTIELHPRMRDNGAVDETRTRDLHLGKVALYQLSYYRKTMGDRRRQGKQALWKLVRAKRLELIRLWHQILNLARLPFRHARTLHTTRMALRLRLPNQDAYLLYSMRRRLSRRKRQFFSASLSRLFTGRAETESRRWRRDPRRSSIPLKGKRANLCRGNVEEFRGRGIDIVFQPC